MQYNITYRQKDNGIQLIISYKDKLGKWKQKSKQGFKTKREAKIAADNLLEELKSMVDLNILSGTENLTIKELKEDYLKHIETHREHNTYLNYSQSLDHFNDINNIQVSKLLVVDVQRCVDKLVNSNYSWNTIDRRLTIFKSMIKFASVQYNLPVINLSSITMPKKKDIKEKKALNDKELYDLLKYFKEKDNDYYKVVLLAATCGLRIGEIVGLTWQDINFNNSTLSINKQWKINKYTKEYGFGELKSKNSYRTVPIPPSTLRELKRMKSSTIINLDQRILNKCKSTKSMSINLDRVLSRKYNICIHELRHTYATKLIASGMDFKTAAQILGHDIEQTMKTYSHVNDDMIKNATNLISKIF